ncbi:FmdB family zinc ribbon protein [Marinicella litoralis]|uniref:Putative FmdB family regulatory protein n=1 Tax=Marinicella litoralis TaxID=644220 RepID=A0A4R6XXR1_9GAMM|nr:zinc ribbon domain-containing protein [Marinicella litoralis]TDR23270.1 putative FmdB family regulatory protein [Marinicella litoralis]
MPIYEYQCQDCDHQLEKLQKMSDAPLSDCPQCEAPSLVKKVSAAGFRLKGTGWYETDFKTKKPAKEPKKAESKPTNSSS